MRNQIPPVEIVAQLQNEIERLLNRAVNAEHAVEQLRSDLELRNQTACDRLKALKRLEPEIERLRTALRNNIAGYGGECGCKETAIYALEQSGDPDKDLPTAEDVRGILGPEQSSSGQSEPCTHKHYSYEKHRRRCSCGILMVDFW